MRKAIWLVFSVVLPAFCLSAQDPAPAPQTQTRTPETAQAPPAEPTEGADPAKVAAPPVKPSSHDDNSFIIGPEDQIEVNIWADNRIGGQFLVRPDGKISMNLLGDVQASNRTPMALASDIAELLKEKDIIRRPEVNVKVLAVKSKKFMINGEVMKTGEFPLVVPTRIMDALVNAGGFRDFANKKNIVIMRGRERLKFNWNEVVNGKKIDQNVFLQHGDIIIVK